MNSYFSQSLIISYFSFVLLQLFKILIWYLQAKQDSSLRFVHITKLQALIYIFVLSVSQVSRLREQNKLPSLPKSFLFLHLVIYCAISFIVKPSHLYPDVQLTFPLHFERNLSTYFIFIIFKSIDNTALLSFQKKSSTEPTTVSSDTFTSPLHLPPWYSTTSLQLSMENTSSLWLARGCSDHLSAHTWGSNADVPTATVGGDSF